MKHLIHWTVAVTFLLLTADALAGHENSACKKTSKAARKACKAETRDDFWIAVGVCNNISDEAEHTECLADANEEWSETHNECVDQFFARQDICAQLGQAPYDPEIDPANFLSPGEIAAAPNPWFPLIPGNTWVYEGDGETITVVVTNETKEILGVTTIVVRDTVVDETGDLIEDTDDWYAQDSEGNLWYFGEIAKNFEDGELVDVEGSWKAGLDGAKAGIIMSADPMVGDFYRQEFALGDAEDMGEVISITGSADVPGGMCDGDCVVTRDFTPIEPDVEENKYYKSGVGLLLEIDPETGERVELVSGP